MVLRLDTWYTLEMGVIRIWKALRNVGNGKEWKKETRTASWLEHIINGKESEIRIRTTWLVYWTFISSHISVKTLFWYFSSIALRFRWQQQYRRRYPDEFLDKANARYKWFIISWDRVQYMILVHELFSFIFFSSSSSANFRTLSSGKCPLSIYYFILSNIIIHNG